MESRVNSAIAIDVLNELNKTCEAHWFDCYKCNLVDICFKTLPKNITMKEFVEYELTKEMIK